MAKEKKIVVVIYEDVGKAVAYTGYVISEDDYLIDFMLRDSSTIRLNKKRIIKVKDFYEGEQK